MMKWLSILFALTVSFGCNSATDAPESTPQTIALNCKILRLEPDFVDRLGFAKENDALILNDIESFFFLDLAAKAKSEPVEFTSGKSVHLADTFETPVPDEWILVSGRASEGKLHLEISSTDESAIRLDHNLIVELPESGSAIIPTANSIFENRLTYVWVIDATQVKR